jgi:hypothetical protein
MNTVSPCAQALFDERRGIRSFPDWRREAGRRGSPTGQFHHNRRMGGSTSVWRWILGAMAADAVRDARSS